MNTIQLSEKIRLSILIDVALQKLEEEHEITPSIISNDLEKVSLTYLTKTRSLHRKEKYQNISLKAIKRIKNSIWQEYRITGETKEEIKIALHGRQAKDVDEDVHYFILHNCNIHLQPDKSLLKVFRAKKTAQLTIFHNKKNEGDRVKRHTYYGKFHDDINTDEEKFGIIFDTRKRERDEPAARVYSFSCFNGDIKNTAQTLFRGVYASSMTTSCGIIILERTSEKDWNEKINSSEIENSILLEIYLSRLTPSEKNTNPSDAVSRKILGEADILVKLYEFFVLDKQQSQPKRFIDESLKKQFSELLHVSPGNLKSFTNEEGLIELTKSLYSAQDAKNTRIFPPKEGGHYLNSAKKWNEVIVQCVENGLTLQEVVSRDFWENEMGELKERLEKNNLYHGVIVDFPHWFESLLNFIILEYKDGAKEVWFGWTFSRYPSMEQLCFQSEDDKLIQFFEVWFRALYSSKLR